MKRLSLLIVFSFLLFSLLHAVVWQPDLGDGRYKNPIIYADYSDPDVIAVHEDYYMISSSFNAVPGLQILHSQDLVNWSIVNAALPERLPGTQGLSSPQWGNCVWAPSLREHDGVFYIFYGDPDRGIYMLQTEDILARWSEPVLVKAGVGFIDPCPLWDEDGKVYLVHGFAGSRAGLKSVLAVCELNETADKAITESRIIYDGHADNPTIEGPKFYKRGGYYYIFAPAGGVKTGWQLAMRSESVYGPYETKIVLEQGDTEINGPHQGAWVHTDCNEDWFLHFQDVGVLGRVVHLQPMQWVAGWPEIGNQGQPVREYKKPKVVAYQELSVPQTSDEFEEGTLGLQWQWAANWQAKWYFCDVVNRVLRLYSVQAESNTTIPNLPNLLLQKAPAPNFTFTAKVRFHKHEKDLQESAGLIVSGMQSQWLDIPAGDWMFVRVEYKDDDHSCRFFTSTDGKQYIPYGETFTATAGHWIGMKVGFFCTRTVKNNDGGWLDIDWVHIE